MNRTIIITGASRGIGRAAALRFATENDRLILAGNHSLDALETLKTEVSALGAEAAIFTGDLSETETCSALSAFAAKQFGTPDILVNNAGISHVELFQDSTDNNYLSILHTNLSSAIRLTKAVLPSMIARHSGRIINLSSVHGLYGASCETEYSVTKGGIIAFTRSLAKELAPSGIQVNCIAPGAIDTEMNNNLTPEEKEALCEEIPAGRFGTPQEVAELISMLASAPAYLTGAVIPIDGGWN